jgi:hypothetical protein
VAFTIAHPISRQGMISILGGQLLIVDQQSNDMDEVFFQGASVLTFDLALEISFEERGTFNRSHSNRPSSLLRCRNGHLSPLQAL